MEETNEKERFGGLIASGLQRWETEVDRLLPIGGIRCRIEFSTQAK